MSARPVGEVVERIVSRAVNLAILNDFLSKIECPSMRKTAIMALWEAECISDNACALLIEHHQLEAA